MHNGWGTSGTVITSTASAMPDHTGAIAGFADAAGGHLPLLAMLNSARVMAATASMLDVDLAKLDSWHCPRTATPAGSRSCRTWAASAAPTFPTRAEP